MPNMINQNWFVAKNIFDHAQEPKLTNSAVGEKRVEIEQPAVNGFPVTYYRHLKNDGKIKSFSVMINPQTNACVVKNFSVNDFYSEAEKIFNS